MIITWKAKRWDGVAYVREHWRCYVAAAAVWKKTWENWEWFLDKHGFIQHCLNVWQAQHTKTHLHNKSYQMALVWIAKECISFLLQKTYKSCLLVAFRIYKRWAFTTLMRTDNDCIDVETWRLSSSQSSDVIPISNSLIHVFRKTRTN